MCDYITEESEVQLHTTVTQVYHRIQIRVSFGTFSIKPYNNCLATMFVSQKLQRICGVE